jgi:hypothetical protein
MSDERGAMNEMQFIAHHSSLLVHRFDFKSALEKQTLTGLLCREREVVALLVGANSI